MRECNIYFIICNKLNNSNITTEEQYAFRMNTKIQKPEPVKRNLLVGYGDCYVRVPFNTIRYPLNGNNFHMMQTTIYYVNIPLLQQCVTKSFSLKYPQWTILLYYKVPTVMHHQPHVCVHMI